MMQIASIALVAALAASQVHGYAKYLDELPNGSLFAKDLGHTDDGYTDFGTAFDGVSATWTTDFCQTTFPSSSMTNGEAFGDPCCVWAVGDTPAFTVTAFTTSPTTQTTCASASASSAASTAATTSSAASATSATSASSSSTPTVTPASTSTSTTTSSAASATEETTDTTEESAEGCGVESDEGSA